LSGFRAFWVVINSNGHDLKSVGRK